MSWSWEYDPSEEYVVRAAAAYYLDGTTYQGVGPGVATAYIGGGMFQYLTVVRHERVYVLQVSVY